MIGRALIAVVIASHAVNAQDMVPIDSLPWNRVELVRGQMPVVYGDSSKSLPDTVEITGVIEQVTFVPVACGSAVCLWGAARVSLKNRPTG